MIWARPGHRSDHYRFSVNPFPTRSSPILGHQTVNKWRIERFGRMDGTFCPHPPFLPHPSSFLSFFPVPVCPHQIHLWGRMRRQTKCAGWSSSGSRRDKSFIGLDRGTHRGGGRRRRGTPPSVTRRRKREEEEDLNWGILEGMNNGKKGRREDHPDPGTRWIVHFRTREKAHQLTPGGGRPWVRRRE